MYHIVKHSRLYKGEPYCGPSSDNEPMETEYFKHAIVLAQALKNRNPVGWDIYWKSGPHVSKLYSTED